MQQNKYTTVDKVKEVLYASSYDLGPLGKDLTYGFGAIDVKSFIKGERGTVTFDMLTDEFETEEKLFIRGISLQELPEPERLYAIFDGWYYDDTFTQEVEYYSDVFYSDITLYAKWVNEDDGIPYTYVILDDGTVEIRSYTDHRRFITIPEKIEGRVVSSIGDSAFLNQTRLCEVILPSGLTNIGEAAFMNCSNLLSIEIPDNVKTIKANAFCQNISLAAVSFGSGSKLESIGTFAFSGCSLLKTISYKDSFVEKLTYTPGDINGDGRVNNRDVACLMQYVAGWDVACVKEALDVNGDGKVNNRDATRLMQYIAKWDVEIH